MFRNVGRRLSRAVRNEGEPEEGTQSQGRGSDRLARGIGPDGSVREEEESTPSSASTPRPEPEPEPEPEPDAARARARSRSRSRSRRRTSTISRHPPPPDLSSSGVAGGKRVQWAPKNRIEHFEHVPLEEESDEESRYVDERMRELDEFGANPVVLARLHQALEPYSLSPGRERSRSTKESELQLPAYISQSKPAPRSKNIKKLLNYPRRSSTVSGRAPSHTKTAVQPPSHAEPSTYRRFSTSVSKDVQDKDKLAHEAEVEREGVVDSGLDPDIQQRSQELRNQPVQRYYDLGHSQLSSVPDIEQEQPLPVSSRVHDWTQKTEGVQDWARKAQTQTQDRDDPESGVEDTALEERGEQEKKWWENRARGLVQAYSTRQRGPLPRTSVTRPVDDGDDQQQRQQQRRATKTEKETETGAGETGRPRRGSRAAAPATTDLEAGQPGPLNEPLPLGSQHGVLGTLLTLYRNPELSRTMSSLESTGDETTTSDIQSLSGEEEDRGGRRQRRDSERADKIGGGEDTIRARRKSSVRGRRPTGLPPARVSLPPPEEEEEEESSSLSSPEVVHREEEEVQPSKRPVRDRRQTGLPPFYIPSSPEESPTPSPSPSPPETQAAPPPPPPPVPEPARAPVPRKGSARGRRQTGLPPLQFPLEQPPPPERGPSPSTTQGEEREEEEAEPQGEPGKKTYRHPYARLVKKSLSASASVLHLPLSGHIPQPQIPAVTSAVPSRSSGGVVAALIATSNTLAGPAAPRANTIAPDLTKRGYTLSRYQFSGGQQPSDVRTATSEDSTLRDRDRDHHERARAGGRPSMAGAEGESEGRLYRPRRGTSETETTDTTLASSAETGAPKEEEEEEYPEKLTKKPSFAWLPGLLSRSGSRGSSIFGDREKEREKGASTDEYTSSQASLSGLDQEALARRIEKRLNKRRRKEKRKMAQIYITKHIAEVLQRQEFMMKFARAHLMFAGPSHRLQGQLQATARVLDLQVSSVHFPNVILISFGDESTSTSMVKIIQQTSTLNLEKLSVMHEMFWKVIHDELSVSSASATLDLLMRSPSRYNNWQMVLTGGLASSAICTISFSGSFADALVVFPLGCLLVIVQLISAKHELYSNVFEITIATLLSFLSAALASSSKFCYAAIASSSVVLILPGFFVLSGSLELASKQIVSGAVRICFAVIYALFLGFGISIGAEVFTRITHRQVVGPDDFLCNTAHMSIDPWWQRKPSLWWAFLTVPLYSFVLTLRNHAPLFKRETLVTIVISCAGWTANHFAGVAFHNRPDLQSAIGAFAVGVIANLYARIFYGNAYVVMITGVLFQLPSGLANGGLLTFAKNDNRADNGFTSFQSGFQVALQLIAVAIGLTVGLFTSVVVVHPLGGSRKGANAVFSL